VLAIGVSSASSSPRRRKAERSERMNPFSFTREAPSRLFAWRTSRYQVPGSSICAAAVGNRHQVHVRPDVSTAVVSERSTVLAFDLKKPSQRACGSYAFYAESMFALFATSEAAPVGRALLMRLFIEWSLHLVASRNVCWWRQASRDRARR